MTRILVTGGRGFVGRALLPRLARPGVEVHAVTSQSAALPGEAAIWHRCDLLDPAATAALVAKIRPSHLVHLAWITEPGIYWNSPRNPDWADASVALVRSFQEMGGGHVLATGTCAEYDPTSGICRENSPLARTPAAYAAAKLHLLSTLQPFAKAHGIRLVWARLFHLFGPHEAPGRLVPSIIQALLQNRPAECSEGTQLRDYAYVENAAAALGGLLFSDFSGTVNVASGEARTVRTLIEAIADSLGSRHLLRFGSIRSKPEDPEMLVADVTRLRKVVGSPMPVDFGPALRRTIDWWRAQTPVPARSEASG